MSSIEQRLSALEEREEQGQAGVLVLFEEATEEQRQEAQAAEQAGVRVIRVIFG